MIGAALLIAISVLLASTAAVFFFNLGPLTEQEKPPTAAFDFDYGADGKGQELDVSHRSGDSIPTEHLYVVVENAACRDPSGSAANPNGRYTFRSLGAARDRVSAGTEVYLDGTNLCGSGDYLILEQATVRVVWRKGADSSRLMGWSGPYVD